VNCEELIRYLSDYIDQGLDEKLRAEAEEHLAACHNCHVVLDTTRKTITLYRAAGRREIPADRRQHLFRQLQEAMEKRDL
jgi:anti-sigma factor RsiW